MNFRMKFESNLTKINDFIEDVNKNLDIALEVQNETRDERIALAVARKKLEYSKAMEDIDIVDVEKKLKEINQSIKLLESSGLISRRVNSNDI